MKKKIAQTQSTQKCAMVGPTAASADARNKLKIQLIMLTHFAFGKCIHLQALARMQALTHS